MNFINAHKYLNERTFFSWQKYDIIFGPPQLLFFAYLDRKESLVPSPTVYLVGSEVAGDFLNALALSLSCYRA